MTSAANYTPALRRARAAACSSAGFTLVELMVSIALVLVLMYGVTKVFSTTQAVVSSNQAISDQTRDARAAQAVMARDFSLAVTADAPFMLLESQRRGGFRNAADDQGDRHAVQFKQ